MLTTSKITEISRRIKKALAAEFGDEVVIETGNIRYTDTSMTFPKFTVKVKEEGESNDDLARREWDNYCQLYNLSKDDFGKVIEYKGKKYSLYGINTRRPKYAIRAKAVAGDDTVLFPATTVRGMLALNSLTGK